MTDFFDRAAKAEMDFQDDARREQARRAGLEGKTAKDSATHCRVCGGRLPAKRRKLLPGVQTCVCCQTELERAVN